MLLHETGGPVQSDTVTIYHLIQNRVNLHFPDCKRSHQACFKDTVIKKAEAHLMLLPTNHMTRVGLHRNESLQLDQPGQPCHCRPTGSRQGLKLSENLTSPFKDCPVEDN